MQIVGLIVIAAGALLVVMLVADRSDSGAYWREYDKAQLQDLEYYRQHPGCSYEEAHRHRDAVMKKYRRY